MKFWDTEFVKQMIGVVAGTFLFVASVAFISIPISLICAHGVSSGCSASQLEWHLT